MLVVGVLIFFGAGPAIPPGATQVVENVANLFDVNATHLLPPLALGGVSALVEGFDDGTFAPSSAVVPLNGNPEAFLAPDSPLPAVIAYYDALDCVELEVSYLDCWLVVISLMPFIALLFYILGKIFQEHGLHHYLRMSLFLSLFLFIAMTLFSIFFVLSFSDSPDDLFYPCSAFEWGNILFDPVEGGEKSK